MTSSPFTNRRRLCLAVASTLLLLLPLVVPLAARGEEKKEQQPVTVPFELLKSQHMTIQVKINGKGPFRLIFDTGAPVTLINNKIAKAAGVFPKDFKAPLFAFFGSMGQFKIKTMEVGDLKVADVNTMVMDHPTVAAISDVLGPIDGIVGFNFFAKFRMTLDYQAKTMTFVPTTFQPQDMMENLMKIIMAGQLQENKKVLAPGGLVGMKVSKDKDDVNPGVRVQVVFVDSPAAKAGFKEGDRLLTLDNRWTDSPIDCYAAASRLTPGRPARAVILRNGTEKELTIEVRAGL